MTGGATTAMGRYPDTASMEKLLAGGASPGFAFVTNSPEGAYEFASGTYSDTDRREVGTHTPYDIASITKLFTTALILRLHDAGSLDLNDRMGRFLPRFAGSSITVTDMLTHRAALKSERLSVVAADFPDMEALAGRVSVPASADEHFFYQNATFLFLGILISKFLGKSIAECMTDFISELGLSETYIGSDPMLDAPPTEIRDGAVWVNRTHDESSYLCGGVTGYAGIFASAGDLAKFGRAWLDFKIALPKTTNMAFTCRSNFPGEEQGLGWYNALPYFPIFPDWLFCHSGYTGPLLAVNPKAGRVYAMTLNRTYYGRGNQLYRELWAWLLEHELREAMTMPAFIRRLELNLSRYANKN